MTISTSKSFGPNGQVTESVRLSQSAAARALAAQSVGLTQSQQQQQATQQRAQQTAIYAGDGNYRTLGGAGGYRPQGRVTSGGAPVGARVPANGGLMGGMPAGQRGDSGGDIEVTERLAAVALERGWQVGGADPNAEGAVVNARYPQDQYLRLPERVLYYWRATVGATVGEWVPTAGPGVVADAAPTGEGLVPFQGWLNRADKSFYVWDEVAALWQGPIGGGGGGPQFAIRHFFNEAAFNFDLQPIAWEGATRADDFTNTFQADGDIAIAAPGWYRLSLQIYQGATDTGSEREIVHQFKATLKDSSNETVPLGDDPDRLLAFAGFTNFSPGTGQADWVFEAATAGKITVEWYWFGYVEGGSDGGNITNAFVGGRAMLEKLK